MRRFIAVITVLSMLTVMLSGCGGGLVAALKIAGVQALLPEKWTRDACVVTLIADILSGSSLRQVIARVTHPTTSDIITVIMTRNTEGRYEGTFEVPPDETQPETYSAVVTAVDQIGAEATSSPVAVEVPPATEAPPAEQ